MPYEPYDDLGDNLEQDAQNLRKGTKNARNAFEKARNRKQSPAQGGEGARKAPAPNHPSSPKESGQSTGRHGGGTASQGAKSPKKGMPKGEATKGASAGAKQAGASGARAAGKAATAGAKKGVSALLASPAGPAILAFLLIAMIIVFVIVILDQITPSVSYNRAMLKDTTADREYFIEKYGEDESKWSTVNTTSGDVRSKEEEFAEIINSKLIYGYGYATDQVREECKKRGFDTQRSLDNMVDNTMTTADDTGEETTNQTIDQTNENSEKNEDAEKVSLNENAENTESQQDQAASSQNINSVAKNSRLSTAAFTNEKKIWLFLRRAGYSEAATAGIMGCFYNESGYNPEAINQPEAARYGERICGIGIAQWSNGRNPGLRSFAESKNQSWKDLNTQLLYVLVETKGRYPSVAQGSGFSRIAGSPQNAYDASREWLRVYEWSAAAKMKQYYEPRGRWAMDVYRRYHGVTVEGTVEEVSGIEYTFGDGTYAVSNRQMCYIIAAFSVYESQLHGGTKKNEKSQTTDAGEEIDDALHQAQTGVAAFTSYMSNRNTIEDLKEVMETHAADFMVVEYGSVAQDRDEKGNPVGAPYFASINVRPANSEEILKNVFGLDPDGIYRTSQNGKSEGESELLGAKDTTNLDAVETLTNSNMALLYGEESDASSSDEMVAGEGKYLNPLGAHTFTSTSIPGQRLCPVHHKWEMHNGWDMACAQGTPVYATADGVVTTTTTHFSYGKYIKIDHGQGDGTIPGLTTMYCHLSKITCKPGDHVKKGQKIGEVGSTGQSTGPHLHFGAIYHNYWVDTRAMIERGVLVALR